MEILLEDFVTEDWNNKKKVSNFTFSKHSYYFLKMMIFLILIHKQNWMKKDSILHDNWRRPSIHKSIKLLLLKQWEFILFPQRYFLYDFFFPLMFSSLYSHTLYTISTLYFTCENNTIQSLCEQNI